MKDSNQEGRLPGQPAGKPQKEAEKKGNPAVSNHQGLSSADRKKDNNEGYNMHRNGVEL